MSSDSSKEARSVVWTGKPWILPGVLARSIAIIVMAVAVYWLELTLGIAYFPIVNMPLILWTGLAFLILWLLGTAGLLLLRASNTYILRSDSMEIRTGILTARAYVISPTGFSDLEVIRTVAARITNSGDIIIRTQSERDSQRRMVRVRNPLKVADQIRRVMARPTVRVEEPA